jgi:hypothetical protein
MMLACCTETYTLNGPSPISAGECYICIYGALTLGNQPVSQKVCLKFGGGIAKLSEKSLTVLKDFVILKF